MATDKESPASPYITPPDQETPALSLTLVPRRIPSREITLAIDGQQWPIKIEMNNFHSTLHLSKAFQKESLSRIFRLVPSLNV